MAYDPIGIPNLKRRLDRYNRMISRMEEDHKGCETTVYNYFAGESIGYFKGKASELENMIDHLEYKNGS